jgi:glycosyltransferase involved in cell wall biosynthesis
MRILILVDCYLPSTKSSAKLIHDLAVALHQLGHETIVVAPDDTLLTPSNVTSEDGITILRIRTGRIKGAPRIVRAFNEACLSSLLWRRGKSFFKTYPCNLIIYYSPSIFWGALVRKLKKLFGCPSYLILRDIFPQWAIDTEVLRKGLIYQFFRYKELEQYAVADVIGVQSPANLRYFSENNLMGRYRIEVLYNWMTLTEQNIPVCNYRSRLGLQGEIIFFYGGNMGVAQDMDNIVLLAKRLQERHDVHFLLVGEGNEVPRLSAQIVTEKINNITIHEAVGQKEYLSMLSEFDVGLITLARNLKTQNFPGKMLGYMYHAMPILASINPGNDLKEILERHQAGLVSLNGEDSLFYKHAMQLIEDPRLRKQLGQNGRALLESTFSATRAAEQILSHFGFSKVG